MTTVQEQIAVIRVAAALLADRAALVPPGPWTAKRILEREVICDPSGRIVARIPEGIGGAEKDSGAYLELCDPRSARLVAALLNAVADGAELALKLLPTAVPDDMPAEVAGYDEALGLARHLLGKAEL